MSQLKLVQTETALNNVYKNFEVNGLDNVDLKTYLEMVASLVEKQLKNTLTTFTKKQSLILMKTLILLLSNQH